MLSKLGFCEKYGITSEQFIGRAPIHGPLYLEGLTSIPDGFNPTVGGLLDLEGLTSIPDGFSPTVGGSLYLSRRVRHRPVSVPPPAVLTWGEGKYCSADGVFGEVVSLKSKGGTNIRKAKTLGGGGIFYVVDNGKFSSHGATIREALSDLRFKSNDRDATQYEGLSVGDALTFDDAVICYRTITGACSFGVSNFLKRKVEKAKKYYTIKEIIELTRGEYGGRMFSEFFGVAVEEAKDNGGRHV